MKNVSIKGEIFFFIETLESRSTEHRIRIFLPRTKSTNWFPLPIWTSDQQPHLNPVYPANGSSAHAARQGIQLQGLGITPPNAPRNNLQGMRAQWVATMISVLLPYFQQLFLSDIFFCFQNLNQHLLRPLPMSFLLKMLLNVMGSRWLENRNFAILHEKKT